MTNREAIEVIKLAQAQVEWEYPMDYATAFDIAISALQEQELKQEVKNSKESSLTHKTLDTISRQEAIDVICNGNCHEEGRSCDDGDCPVVREIKALPSAQSEIVRCKDCKYLQKWRSEESAKKFGQIYECVRNVFDYPKPEDFCSYAERRPDDANANA